MSIAEKITRLNTAKNDIATAIISKGVEVAETDGLESFAEKINGISTGGAPEIMEDAWFEQGNLPISFARGSAVWYNDELHLIGGWDGSTYRSHYKFNGKTGSSVSTLPYDFMGSAGAVVYNGEIHILGNGTSLRDKHYKWNGSRWISESTLPFNIYYAAGSVVYNNEIHIMAEYKHYKWNGSEWISASTLPVKYEGYILVYNDEIHILGSMNSAGMRSHYKWNGSSWISASTLPVDLSVENLKYVANNLICISCDNTIYSWDGVSWKVNGTPPVDANYGCGINYNEYTILLGFQIEGAGKMWFAKKYTN